jgi:hypothetical protein
MEKQTAVEWLFMTLALTPMTDWYNVLEQAKAMEKEQINKACYDGYYKEDEKYTYDYYNETYNK